MSKRPELVILNGPLAGRRFAVDHDQIRLGRSSSNDIHVPDEELSRNHCLFEPIGETEIRLTDLASANGTFVNGESVGSAAKFLKEGDEIRVGQTKLRVGDPPPPMNAETLDLGLGDTASLKKPETAKPRSKFANLLWAVALVVMVGAIYLILQTPAPAPSAPIRAAAVESADPVVKEVAFERVLADSSSIFRYALNLTEDGVLTVRVDDVPKENRHHTKSARLSPEALAELNEILAFRHLKDLDREYAGAEPDPPALESWDLRIVYDIRAKRIRITNTQEPEAFRIVREKLEAFSKSELGIWAIQYPREKLVELSAKALELAQAKWNDRDVNYGNLAAAISAYNESLFYLETVDPKPETAALSREGLRQATDELERRYREQRFRADRALNLAQWETACEELRVLLELVPDRRDDRNRDAHAKLLSAEGNLKKKGTK